MAKRKPSYIAFRQKLLTPVPLPFDPEVDLLGSAAGTITVRVVHSARKWHDPS